MKTFQTWGVEYIPSGVLWDTMFLTKQDAEQAIRNMTVSWADGAPVHLWKVTRIEVREVKRRRKCTTTKSKR